MKWLPHWTMWIENLAIAAENSIREHYPKGRQAEKYRVSLDLPLETVQDMPGLTQNHASCPTSSRSFLRSSA